MPDYTTRLCALAVVIGHLSQVKRDLEAVGIPASITQAKQIGQAIEKADGELSSILSRLAGPVWVAGLA